MKRRVWDTKFLSDKMKIRIETRNMSLSINILFKISNVINGKANNSDIIYQLLRVGKMGGWFQVVKSLSILAGGEYARSKVIYQKFAS